MDYKSTPSAGPRAEKVPKGSKKFQNLEPGSKFLDHEEDLIHPFLDFTTFSNTALPGGLRSLNTSAPASNGHDFETLEVSSA